ncbi:hypothetical protein SAMN04488074_13711 [Lentzea albidocapillata subsp. violacea]|uniref:Uncharacterized protein n=1 Tax=Lentzea albidocapillata subsp. violacea TaxID=128104 RepID=A0A1G9Z5P2_9PSEU|nr:hypothetical protein SAMN04488074_13711 [Lentzea albidocapillata subsp. violacea]
MLWHCIATLISIPRRCACRRRIVRWCWRDSCTCWPPQATRLPHPRARSAAVPIACWSAAPRTAGAATGASTRQQCGPALGAGRKRSSSPADRKDRSAGGAMRPTRTCSRNVSNAGVVAGRPNDEPTVPPGASPALPNLLTNAFGAVITARRRRSRRTVRFATTATSVRRGVAGSAATSARSASARSATSRTGVPSATGRPVSAWSADGSGRAAGSAAAAAHFTAPLAGPVDPGTVTTAARPPSCMETGPVARSASAATSTTCATQPSARNARSCESWSAAPKPARTSADRARDPQWTSPAAPAAVRGGCTPTAAAPAAW